MRTGFIAETNTERTMQMGQTSELIVAAWQKKAGLKPAADQETLRKLSDAAFELIKIIELEKSGIRDGDGYWHGGDVMGGIVSEMRGLLDRLSSADDAWFREHTGFKSAAEARQAHDYWRRSPTVLDGAGNDLPW
jgi:hypothetical protein